MWPCGNLLRTPILYFSFRAQTRYIKMLSLLSPYGRTWHNRVFIFCRFRADILPLRLRASLHPPARKNKTAEWSRRHLRRANYALWPRDNRQPAVKLRRRKEAEMTDANYRVLLSKHMWRSSVSKFPVRLRCWKVKLHTSLEQFSLLCVPQVYMYNRREDSALVSVGVMQRLIYFCAEWFLFSN